MSTKKRPSKPLFSVRRYLNTGVGERSHGQRPSRSAGNEITCGLDRNNPESDGLRGRQLLHDAASIVADANFFPQLLLHLPVQIFGA